MAFNTSAYRAFLDLVNSTNEERITGCVISSMTPKYKNALIVSPPDVTRGKMLEDILCPKTKCTLEYRVWYIFGGLDGDKLECALHRKCPSDLKSAIKLALEAALEASKNQSVAICEAQ